MSKPNEGPRLKKNDRGVYEIHWTDDGRSKRRSTRETNAGNAQMILAAFILQKDDVDARAADPMIADILDHYMQEHVEHHVAGKDIQQFAINKLADYFGSYFPRELNQTHINLYTTKRTSGVFGRKCVPGTVRRELSVLIAALNFCAKVGFGSLTRADVPYIQLPPKGAPKDRVVSSDEAEALYQAAAIGCEDRLSRIYRFLVIATEAAQRKSAITELTWKQVDFDVGVINFNPSGRLQTKKRRPVVPMSDTLREVLLVAKQQATGDYVLDHPGSISKPWRTLAKKVGLNDVTPHTLRHTWATDAAAAGVSMWEIAGVLGDTVETVTKNYLHLSPDHLRSAVNFRKTTDQQSGVKGALKPDRAHLVTNNDQQQHVQNR